MASMGKLLMHIESMIMYVLKCRATPGCMWQPRAPMLNIATANPSKTVTPTSCLDNNNDTWSNFWMAIS